MNLSNKKILVLAPHPDDEALSCGGLITKATSMGSEVFVLFFAVGNCRQLSTGNTKIGTRLEEALNASRFAGYNYDFMYVGDEHMKLDSLPLKLLIDKIEDTIEVFKPDIVCIPSQNSYNQDHRTVFDASIAALRPTPRNLRHFVPCVIECEEPYTWGVGEAFKPNLFIDITDFLDKKLELLACHATQNRADPFPRSKQNLTRLAGFRGAEAGIKYAEGYKIHRLCD